MRLTPFHHAIIKRHRPIHISLRMSSLANGRFIFPLVGSNKPCSEYARNYLPGTKIGFPINSSMTFKSTSMPCLILGNHSLIPRAYNYCCRILTSSSGTFQEPTTSTTSMSTLSHSLKLTVDHKWHTSSVTWTIQHVRAPN